MLLFANFCNHLIDKFNNCLVDLMTLVDSFDHLSFRNLVCTCFDHDNLSACRSYCKLQVTVLPLLLAWVYDEFTINHTKLCCSTWSIKRNVGNSCCNCRTQHSNQLRTALRINAHYHIVQCNVISVILREQRTHRSVDYTAGKDCVLACLTFSLVKAAGNLAYCI